MIGQKKVRPDSTAKIVPVSANTVWCRLTDYASALSTLKIWVKGSGVNCAQYPKGRWRQLTPAPFTRPKD